MASVTQKAQYALRALFELALRQPQGKPVAVSEIAAAQDIPPRFLHLILADLKQAGYVAARRGAEGGYVLSRAPKSVTVGEIIRLIDGSPDPVECLAADSRKKCGLRGRCAFIGLWERARDALNGVYETTTLQTLVDESRVGADTYAI